MTTERRKKQVEKENIYIETFKGRGRRIKVLILKE